MKKGVLIDLDHAKVQEGEAPDQVFRRVSLQEKMEDPSFKKQLDKFVEYWDLFASKEDVPPTDRIVLAACLVAYDCDDNNALQALRSWIDDRKVR